MQKIIDFIKNNYLLLIILYLIIVSIINAIYIYIPQPDEWYYLHETIVISELLKQGHWIGDQMIGTHGFFFKIPPAIIFMFTEPTIYIPYFYHIILNVLIVFFTYRSALKLFDSDKWAALASFFLINIPLFYQGSLLNAYLRETPALFTISLVLYLILYKKNIIWISLALLLSLEAKEYVGVLVIVSYMVYLIYETVINYKPNYFKMFYTYLYKSFVIVLPISLYLFLMYFTPLIPENQSLSFILKLNIGSAVSNPVFELGTALYNAKGDDAKLAASIDGKMKKEKWLTNKDKMFEMLHGMKYVNEIKQTVDYKKLKYENFDTLETNYVINTKPNIISLVDNKNENNKSNITISTTVKEELIKEGKNLVINKNESKKVAGRTKNISSSELSKDDFKLDKSKIDTSRVNITTEDNNTKQLDSLKLIAKTIEAKKLDSLKLNVKSDTAKKIESIKVIAKTIEAKKLDSLKLIAKTIEAKKLDSLKLNVKSDTAKKIESIKVIAKIENNIAQSNKNIKNDKIKPIITNNTQQNTNVQVLKKISLENNIPQPKVAPSKKGLSEQSNTKNTSKDDLKREEIFNSPLNKAMLYTGIVTQRIFSHYTFNYGSAPIFMIVSIFLGIILILKKSNNKQDWVFIIIFLFFVLAVYILRTHLTRYFHPAVISISLLFIFTLKEYYHKRWFIIILLFISLPLSIYQISVNNYTPMFIASLITQLLIIPLFWINDKYKEKYIISFVLIMILSHIAYITNGRVNDLQNAPKGNFEQEARLFASHFNLETDSLVYFTHVWYPGRTTNQTIKFYNKSLNTGDDGLGFTNLLGNSVEKYYLNKNYTSNIYNMFTFFNGVDQSNWNRIKMGYLPNKKINRVVFLVQNDFDWENLKPTYNPNYKDIFDLYEANKKGIELDHWGIAETYKNLLFKYRPAWLELIEKHPIGSDKTMYIFRINDKL